MTEFFSPLAQPAPKAQPSATGGGGGGWDDELDFGDDDDLADVGGQAKALSMESSDDFFVAPQAGTRAATHWVNNSSHAADHIAAGSFETAMQLLNRQIAMVNFDPLKPQFVGVFCGAVTALPGLALSPALLLPVQRSAASPESKSLPSICLKLPWLIETLKSAYKHFHMGNFAESLEAFKTIIRAVPLVVTSSRSESSEVRNHIKHHGANST